MILLDSESEIMARKLLCEINPFFYEVSLRKEYLKRDIKDLFSFNRFANNRSEAVLPNIVKSHCSVLIRNLHGVDIKLQESKVKNIELACSKLNSIIIHPNEVFSFWRLMGRPTAKDGYQHGLIIKKYGMGSAIGGGLCQMANMIHWLVLNSPLEVVEIHHHSDALFPDENRRVPFGTGTSVLYKHVDYRFKNNTNQDIQILLWIANGELCGELRSNEPFLHRYKLVEENNHFKKVGDDYYRISQIYKITIDKSNNQELSKDLILDNYSKVMYNHNLIPESQIRE